MLTSHRRWAPALIPPPMHGATRVPHVVCRPSGGCSRVWHGFARSGTAVSDPWHHSTFGHNPLLHHLISLSPTLLPGTTAVIAEHGVPPATGGAPFDFYRRRGGATGQKSPTDRFAMKFLRLRYETLEAQRASAWRTDLQISVTRPTELGLQEIALWHAMQHKTRTLASPFLSPEFAIAVDSVRSDARVAVLRDGPDIVGFFPYQRRRLGVGVPIGTGMNDCQGVVCEPDVKWETTELLRACGLTAWQFDCLLNDQRPFERFLRNVSCSPIIDVTAGFSKYQDELRHKSPQFCKDLARKERKLEREVGELRFEVDSRDTSELRTLIGWKSDQYRRTGWFDFFDREWLVALVDVLFGTRTDQFAGLLSVLSVDGAPIAAHFGLRFGSALAHCYPAYDPDFARYSPGLIHHLRMIEQAAGMGIFLIDMGKGDERYKQTLKSFDVHVGEGVATCGPVASTFHRARANGVRWAGPRIRQHPRALYVVDWFLRHAGRTT